MNEALALLLRVKSDAFFLSRSIQRHFQPSGYRLVSIDDILKDAFVMLVDLSDHSHHVPLVSSSSTKLKLHDVLGVFVAQNHVGIALHNLI